MIRTEFEDKLKERDTQLTEAREELQLAKETLRHQQLLSVVRGMNTYTTATNRPATPSTPLPTPASSPLVGGNANGDAGEINLK